jgi:quercetin dioxygenase-like cupin family protein
MHLRSKVASWGSRCRIEGPETSQTRAAGLGGKWTFPAATTERTKSSSRVLLFVGRKPVVRLRTLAIVGGLALAGAFIAASPAHAQVPGECTAPAAGRTNELGCYLLTETPVGALSSNTFYWHIVRYKSRASADADRGKHETVVDSLGSHWLFAIEDRRWKPKNGEEVAVIGPLPLPRARSYTARYMEAVSMHGLQSTVHRHSGPEAWYMVSGTQCLEVPGQTLVVSAGHSSLVKAGPPMRLSTLGRTKRRALVLVLHDSSKPWMQMALDWKPQGLCERL